MGATKNSARFFYSVTVALLVCTRCGTTLFAQPHPIVVQKDFLPEITTLSSRIRILDATPPTSVQNFILRDYNSDVEQAAKAYARGDSVVVQFYRYTVQQGDTIFTLAADLSVSQETIATANAVESADSIIVGRELILPAAAGLFVPLAPQTPLEILSAEENAAYIQQQRASLPVYTIRGRDFYFLQTAHFSSTTRAFFLDTSMRMPLADYVLTSRFGGRISPISGRWIHHNGVDLAAPTGTPVYACKRGTVLSATYGDEIYGNNIILQHANGMTSRYAHLSQILVRKGESVSTGTEIGKVGTTGLSTGPHLHFEVWQNGKATNPLRNAQ